MSDDENGKGSGYIREGVRFAASSVVGGVFVYGVVAVTGMTAVGMIGGGAGVGLAAGPVGVAAGAVVGLAICGIYRAFKGR